MTHLVDHPVDHPSDHLATYAAESLALEPTGWDAWIDRVEFLLDRPVDGDQTEDGFILDGFHDLFEAGRTPLEAVEPLVQTVDGIALTWLRTATRGQVEDAHTRGGLSQDLFEGYLTAWKAGAPRFASYPNHGGFATRGSARVARLLGYTGA